MPKQSFQITVISQNPISHAGTLRPRLGFCIVLIDKIVSQLELKGLDLKKINSTHADDLISDKYLDQERLIHQTVASLEQIHKKISDICELCNIPSALAPTIPAIRTLSSSLFELMPDCSQQLCELSTTLGSIVTDSAILTSATCDFGISNIESCLILDEAKLMADSKISKQYPNLQTPRNSNV